MINDCRFHIFFKQAVSLFQKSDSLYCEQIESKTSVPNGQNRPTGRKSAGAHEEKLPCQTVKSGFRGGSQRARR